MYRCVLMYPVTFPKLLLVGSAFGPDMTWWFGALSRSTRNKARTPSVTWNAFWTLTSNCFSSSVRTQLKRWAEGSALVAGRHWR